MIQLTRVVSLLLVLLAIDLRLVSAEHTASLSADLKPWLEVVQGKTTAFSLQGSAEPIIDDEPQRIEFKLTRFDDQAFDLEITHTKYAVGIHRREQATAIVLPKHQVVYLGKGSLESQDHLQPLGLLDRLISDGSILNVGIQTIGSLTSDDLFAMLQTFAGMNYDADKGTWIIDDKHELRFSHESLHVDAQFDGIPGHMELSPIKPELVELPTWDGYKIVELQRIELERQLARGMTRACEVLAPSALLTSPVQRSKKVEHGELRYVDGHRVCLLHGTPEEIGTAHGELLKKETERCIDSVLYAFGTVQTVATGKWFRHELEAAYARLEPHIPQRHKDETRALAMSIGQDADLMEALNVFPELFHCSGFALFGDATVGGKLYHGRVLDYMTTIGLQDSATTFVVSPKDRIAFANIGYAGFIGSVSGMNAEKISLGEMGGRGEGQWDGVPMATLMRRALEECDSLDEVRQLWANSPRTCEYYYVFADGETKQAVGVAATPQEIEFVEPGAFHERLGEGIKDAVVLSAGSRLEELRRRVTDNYGKIDEDAAMQLMCRPVAMKSNLHNVLFVPEDGVFFVANANHKDPAADRPYTKLDLVELLQQIPDVAKQTSHRFHVDQTFVAKDTLDLSPDGSTDANLCLNALRWKPQEFTLVLEKDPNAQSDWLVRFPSPRPCGDVRNDLVAMEWYQARGKDGRVIDAPAVVVVHESGKGMNVGRLIAKTLRGAGIHTFMTQLPYYGVRRPPEGRAKGEQLIQAIQQSVTDVRRARDAVAALPCVVPEKIDLQGTSLGGFVTATAGSLDRGYRNVFILLAGGDLYGTLMEGQRDAAKVRNELINSGLSEDEIREGLYAIEPLRLAHRLQPERTWLFYGAFDNVVTPRSSKLLAQAAGLDKTHYIEMLANHYSGIIFLPTVAMQISNAVKR